MGNSAYIATIKVVLLGESSVGKTAIVTRFTTGEFQTNNATIGAAFTTKELEWVGEEDDISRKVRFEIWDTAGQERYRSLAPMYYRNTDVAVVVFDVTQPESRDKAKSWIDELHCYVEDYKKDDIVVQVVANKSDLIVRGESEDVWNGVKLVSAKTGDGIEQLFKDIAENMPLDKFKLVGGNNELANVDENTSRIELDSVHRAINNATCNC